MRPRRETPEHLQLMRQIHDLLLGADRKAALDAIGDVLLLLCVELTPDLASVHTALEEELHALHYSAELNYETAAKIVAEVARQGATVH